MSLYDEHNLSVHFIHGQDFRAWWYMNFKKSTDLLSYYKY